MRGDVNYKSKVEPVSNITSGKYEEMPGYDPLAFAIEECHKRGMECHGRNKYCREIMLQASKHRKRDRRKFK